MDDLFEKAARLLADDPRILALWGFGSRARGTHGPRSDVDLAVLLDAAPTLMEKLRLRADVVDDLGRDDVDLVVLNQAAPLLRYEVLKDGRRLFARDEEAADAFELRALREYLDTRHLRAVQRRLAREALDDLAA